MNGQELSTEQLAELNRARIAEAEKKIAEGRRELQLLGRKNRSGAGRPRLDSCKKCGKPKGKGHRCK